MISHSHFQWFTANPFSLSKLLWALYKQLQRCLSLERVSFSDSNIVIEMTSQKQAVSYHEGGMSFT